jgi:hypothetical protein
MECLFPLTLLSPSAPKSKSLNSTLKNFITPSLANLHLIGPDFLAKNPAPLDLKK